MVLFGTKNTKKNLSNKYIKLLRKCRYMGHSLKELVQIQVPRYLLLSGLQFSNVYKNCDNRNK